jgi:S-adenosylmethionine synthetase
VTSALELRDAVLAEAQGADAVVMAAAVADYRPGRAARDQAQEDRDADRRARAEPRRAAELRRPRRRGQVLVGFAAETGDAEGDVLAHGRAKLARKGCDLLVVNEVGEPGHPDRLRGRRNAATVLAADGASYDLPLRARTRSPTRLGPGRRPRCLLGRLAPRRPARVRASPTPEEPVSRRLFTSESVTEGTPTRSPTRSATPSSTRCCEQDPKSRVAVETLITTGQVHIAGEVTTDGYADIADIVRKTILEIGYDSSKKGFDGESCGVSVSIGSQSPDIAQGVDEAYEARVEGETDELEKQGAGDQGLMFGFACDETPELMPLPIALAHRLSRRLTAGPQGRHRAVPAPGRQDQVTIEYLDGKPVRLDTVVVSSQHAEDIDIVSLLTPDIAEHVVAPRSPDLGIETEGYRLLVNPTGKFVIGGPMGDAGLTGRKIIVTPTAATPGTAAAPSPARTRPRSTAPPPTRCAGSPRTSSPPAWPPSARCRSPTPSARPSRSGCSSTPTAPAWSTTRRCRTRSPRCSTCAPPRSSATSTCCARSTLRPPPTATSAASADFTWESTDRAELLKKAAGQ